MGPASSEMRFGSWCYKMLPDSRSGCNLWAPGGWAAQLPQAPFGPEGSFRTQVLLLECRKHTIILFPFGWRAAHWEPSLMGAIGDRGFGQGDQHRSLQTEGETGT